MKTTYTFSEILMINVAGKSIKSDLDQLCIFKELNYTKKNSNDLTKIPNFIFIKQISIKSSFTFTVAQIRWLTINSLESRSTRHQTALLRTGIWNIGKYINDLIHLQSNFFPAKIFFCILEKRILAGNKLLCKEGFLIY